MSNTNVPEMKTLSQPERSRTYVFAAPDRQAFRLTYRNVKAVGIRPSGAHRLELADQSPAFVIIPAGWVAIELDIDDWSF
jgi:hypothetical protein